MTAVVHNGLTKRDLINHVLELKLEGTGAVKPRSTLDHSYSMFIWVSRISTDLLVFFTIASKLLSFPKNPTPLRMLIEHSFFVAD